MIGRLRRYLIGLVVWHRHRQFERTIRPWHPDVGRVRTWKWHGPPINWDELAEQQLGRAGWREPGLADDTN